MELQYIKNDKVYEKWGDKLPCKYDPSNPGIGCKQPRHCFSCGWNPAVKAYRDREIRQKRMKGGAG